MMSATEKIVRGFCFYPPNRLTNYSVHMTFVYNFIVLLRFAFINRNQTS